MSFIFASISMLSFNSKPCSFVYILVCLLFALFTFNLFNHYRNNFSYLESSKRSKLTCFIYSMCAYFPLILYLQSIYNYFVYFKMKMKQLFFLFSSVVCAKINSILRRIKKMNERMSNTIPLLVLLSIT